MACLLFIDLRQSWVPPAAWYHHTAPFTSGLRTDRWERSPGLRQPLLGAEIFHRWLHSSFVRRHRRQCLTSSTKHLPLQVSRKSLHIFSAFPRDDAQGYVSARESQRAETYPCASSHGNASRGKDRRVVGPRIRPVMICHYYVTKHIHVNYKE